jgi:RES domain
MSTASSDNTRSGGVDITSDRTDTAGGQIVGRDNITATVDLSNGIIVNVTLNNTHDPAAQASIALISDHLRRLTEENTQAHALIAELSQQLAKTSNRPRRNNLTSVSNRTPSNAVFTRRALSGHGLEYDALTKLPHKSENGFWYRWAPLKLHPTMFQAPLTKVVRSRFNAGDILPIERQFSCLYFAEDPITAMFEVGAMLGNMSPGQYIENTLGQTGIVLTVQVHLQHVIDLFEKANSDKIKMSAQEMTGDWQNYNMEKDGVRMAPTQMLGEALFRTGVEGFVARSVRVPFKRTLGVFPDNLGKHSNLVYQDSEKTVVHRIGMF